MCRSTSPDFPGRKWAVVSVSFCLWHFLESAHIPPLHPRSVSNRRRVWVTALHICRSALCGYDKSHLSPLWFISRFPELIFIRCFLYDNRFVFQLELARPVSGLCNRRLLAFLHIFKWMQCRIKTMPSSYYCPPAQCFCLVIQSHVLICSKTEHKYSLLNKKGQFTEQALAFSYELNFFFLQCPKQHETSPQIIILYNYHCSL